MPALHLGFAAVPPPAAAKICLPLIHPTRPADPAPPGTVSSAARPWWRPLRGRKRRLRLVPRMPPGPAHAAGPALDLPAHNREGPQRVEAPPPPAHAGPPPVGGPFHCPELTTGAPGRPAIHAAHKLFSPLVPPATADDAASVTPA